VNSIFLLKTEKKVIPTILRKEAFMFGSLGAPELLIILLIVIVIFGARRLPELGKSLGEGIKNFKRAVSSHKEENNSSNSPTTPNPPAAN
jgi:sec-independent protein translocase protein TatA